MGVEPARLRRIYLEDGLAALAGGEELVRRMRAQTGDDEIRQFVTEVEADLANDRSALEELLGDERSRGLRVKSAGARAAVWAGRLKLNGNPTGYSPLSRATELAGVRHVLEADRALWRSLERLGEGSDAAARADRCDEQLRRAEELRLEAVDVALRGLDRRL